MAAMLLGIIFLAMSTYGENKKANLVYWLIEGGLILMLLAATSIAE